MTPRERRVVWFVLACAVTGVVVSTSWLLALGPNRVAFVALYASLAVWGLLVVCIPRGGMS